MSYQKNVQAFCSNACSLREKYQLSYKSMAMLLDIEEEDVLALESGHLTDHITVDTLFRTMDVFSIPVDELFSMPPVCEGPAVSSGNAPSLP